MNSSISLGGGGVSARTLSNQTLCHWRRILLQRGADTSLRLAVPHRLAGHDAGRIQPSRQDGGIDLPGRIGRLTLRT